MITSKLHENFCSNMKSRRLSLNLTQAELAKRLTVSQAMISQLEIGSWVPTLDTVEAVARALELPNAECLLHKTSVTKNKVLA